MVRNNNNFTQINLELRNSRITLTTSADENFHLASKREHEYSFSEDGQTLSLRQYKWRWYHYVVPILSWRLPTKTELKVPASFKGKIAFSNKNGWVRLSKFECENINISNRNGKLLADGIKSGNIEFSVNNGRVELKKIKADSLKGFTRNGRTNLDDVDVEIIEWKSNNGKVLVNKVDSEVADISTNNGKIICNFSNAERMKLETKNGKILGNDIDAATIEADTKNGKIIFEKLDAYSIKLQTANGKIRASLGGEERDYAFDIKLLNGKSMIAGKKNSGSYVLKDKDKKKQLTAGTKNGNASFVFLNSDS